MKQFILKFEERKKGEEVIPAVEKKGKIQALKCSNSIPTTIATPHKHQKKKKKKLPDKSAGEVAMT